MMKALYSYLKIMLFGIGTILVSCQSGGTNQPAKNVEDSTAVIIDSAAIIAERERIATEEAEKAEREAEKKAELEQLSKCFNEKKDEFSDKIWIHPKDEPKYRNRNATFCYFMKRNGTVSNLRFVFQYESDDWLFIKDLIFNIDGKVFEYRRLDFETDCGYGGRIWEWCDLQLTDVTLINALENAKNVKIKMNGEKYYDTRTLKAATITSIQNTIKYYKALGGKV